MANHVVEFEYLFVVPWIANNVAVHELKWRFGFCDNWVKAGTRTSANMNGARVGDKICIHHPENGSCQYECRMISDEGYKLCAHAHQRKWHVVCRPIYTYKFTAKLIDDGNSEVNIQFLNVDSDDVYHVGVEKKSNIGWVKCLIKENAKLCRNANVKVLEFEGYNGRCSAYKVLKKIADKARVAVKKKPASQLKMTAMFQLRAM